MNFEKFLLSVFNDYYYLCLSIIFFVFLFIENIYILLLENG